MKKTIRERLRWEEEVNADRERERENEKGKTRKDAKER